MQKTAAVLIFYTGKADKVNFLSNVALINYQCKRYILRESDVFCVRVFLKRISRTFPRGCL